MGWDRPQGNNQFLHGVSTLKYDPVNVDNNRPKTKDSRQYSKDKSDLKKKLYCIKRML